jgi:hypothetical protein
VLLTGRSLLADALAEADRAKQALERVLACCDLMDTSASAPVRTAAATIRTVIAQPKEGK